MQWTSYDMLRVYFELIVKVWIQIQRANRSWIGLESAFENLVHEVPHQVAVVEFRPGRCKRGTGRIMALRQVDLSELDRFRRREMQRLLHIELGDEPRHRSALRAIDPDLNSRIVADRDIAGLQQPLRAVGVFHDRDRAVLLP